MKADIEKFHAEVAETYENTFGVPFGSSLSDIEAAHKAGIPAQQFAIFLGLREGYKVVRKGGF